MSKKEITAAIKALLLLTNTDRQTVAKALNMDQSMLRAKFSRATYTGEEIIKIANACHAQVSFTDANGHIIVSIPNAIDEK